jgi:CheY-like chemotaxis protein
MDDVPAVLVVDDDHDVREGIADFLREDGFDVITARNGIEALETLRVRRDVRVIVLDMMMPGMDGATFRQKQLANESLSSIPFVLLTGRFDCAHLATALGASACLRKPFKPNDLLPVMRPFR